MSGLDEYHELEAEGALVGLELPPVAAARRLRGHASTRRFFRLATKQGACAVLMVYPEDGAAEALDRFERTASWFCAAGVRVPRVWRRGERALIMEDGGDQMLDETASSDAPRLYRQAMSILARLQAHGARTPSPNPDWALDGERFMFELEFMEQHAVRAWLGEAGGGEARRSFYADLAGRLQDLPCALCHRDFHSRNLMVHNDRLFVVDFQDAMDGPVYYDAASLLLDNYVDVPAEVVAASLATAQTEARVAHAVDMSLDVPEWPSGLAAGNRQAFALTALERSLKALGTFGYQVTQGGNPDYARYAGRTWGHARRLLRGLGWQRYEESLGVFDHLGA